MSVTARLKSFLRDRGIKPQQLAAQAGLKPAAIHKALSKDGGLRSDTIEAVMRRFPELDPDWLILGEGEMLREPKRSPVMMMSTSTTVEMATRSEVEELRVQMKHMESLLQAEREQVEKKGVTPAKRKQAG